MGNLTTKRRAPGIHEVFNGAKNTGLIIYGSNRQNVPYDLVDAKGVTIDKAFTCKELLERLEKHQC